MDKITSFFKKNKVFLFLSTSFIAAIAAASMGNILAAILFSETAVLYYLFASEQRAAQANRIVGESCAAIIEAYTKMFPIGEVVDRQTINDIKLAKGLIKGDDINFIIILSAWLSILTETIVEKKELLSLTVELTEINKKQWELEDRVREGDERAALEARINNNLRVQTKNKINKLFGVEEEKKFYASN